MYGREHNSTYLAGVNALGCGDRGKDHLNAEKEERLSFHIVLRLRFDGFVVVDVVLVRIRAGFHWETTYSPRNSFIEFKTRPPGMQLCNINMHVTEM